VPETKGVASPKGKVNHCPACGIVFNEPLDGGVRVECADEEDGGCARAYRVMYVD